MDRGYDNSACTRMDCEAGAPRTATGLEMDRVTVQRTAGAPQAKCCGGGRDRAVPNVPPSACPPKCPAVVTSPWDPVKTWLAVFLSVAMIVWAALGVYYIKYNKP